MGLFDALSPPTGPITQAGSITGKAIPKATQQQVWGLQGQQGTLTDAEKAALAATQGATTAGTGYLNQALGLYGPLAGITGGAEQMYANALGLGGQSGTQAALGAFQQGPGYQYQLQQGLDALQREANSRGMLASGNLTQDELAYSQNLANQGWQNWLNQLGGLGAQNQGVLGAEAGLYGGLADIAGQGGARTAGIYGAFAPEIGATQADIGQTKAGGTMAAAQNKAQTLANLYNANMQGSQNFLGLLGSAFNPLAYLGGKAMA